MRRLVVPSLVVLLLVAGAAAGAAGVGILRAPTDFSIYFAAARVALQGGDPYNWHALRQVAPWVPAPGFVYPLWGLLPIIPLAWLPLPAAAGIWLAGNLVCLTGSVWVLVRAAGMSTRSLWVPTLVGVACLSISGLFVLIQGQMSLLLLACVALALADVQARRGRLAGALLALSLAKPQLTVLPVLALLMIAWREGVLRRTLLWCGGALGLLLAGSFAAQPRWLTGWLAALSADASQGGAGNAALRANMGTLPAVAAHLPPIAGALLLAAGVVAGACLLWWLVWDLSQRDVTRGTELALLSGATCVGTALSPWMWIYDGVFWLAPLALLIAWGPAWRRWAAVAVFWALPWAVRIGYVAGGSGTSLNKLEDAAVAPLLALLLVLNAPLPRWRPLAWRATPASVIPAATPSGQRSPSASTAASAAPARRRGAGPRPPSQRG